MDPATGRTNGSPKRMRIIDPSSNETRPGQKPTKAPLLIAIAFIEETSSQSLQLHIAPIFSTLATNHCRTMAKIHNKLKQVEKMQADDELIPRSARVKFEFQVSKATATDVDFLNIKSETHDLVVAFQKALKIKIIAASKIEIKLAERIAKTDLCRSLRSACKTFIVASSATSTPDLVANTVIERHGASLLKYFPDLDSVAFRRLYKEVHGLGTLPNPEPVPRLRPALREPPAGNRGPVIDHSDSLGFGLMGMEIPVYDRVAAIPAANIPIGPIHVDSVDYARLSRIFLSLFIDSWSAYLNQAKENATNLELKKLYTDTFVTKATEDTAMELDEEMPKDRGQLNDLIKKSTAEATNRLTQELKAIKTAIGAPSKNTGRRGQQGASVNKKQIQPTKADAPRTSNKRSKSRSSNQKQDQKRPAKPRADAAARDSTDAPTNAQNNRSQEKSTKKQSPSKTRRRKQPTGSTNALS
jgi:hypothetical protein